MILYCKETKLVGIYATKAHLDQIKFLEELGSVFNIEFVKRKIGDNENLSGWIMFDGNRKLYREIAKEKVPCYIIVDNEDSYSYSTNSAVEFSKDGWLPKLLMGRKIENANVKNCNILPDWLSSELAIAKMGNAPIWSTCKLKIHHFVSIEIPALKDAVPLFCYFHGKDFISVLPLFLFLKKISQKDEWDPPPLQAAFMFDDPNLHWRTYGFIDFAEISRYADLYNYHVAFATIPQDSWFFHKKTSELFRYKSNRLSLLMHGNDHVSCELSRQINEQDIYLMFSQALNRIIKFEERSGLEVSRIMTAPHGACRENYIKVLALIGFDGLCISKWSLMSHNPRANWLQTLGLKPSDFVSGLTILPRFRISKDCHNSILFSALLNQPIIPVGHHNDIADGINILNDLSCFINSLGNVKWNNFKRLIRTHYETKKDNNALHIRMHSNNLEIVIPCETSEIIVYPPNDSNIEPLKLFWKDERTYSNWNGADFHKIIDVHEGQRIEINTKYVIGSNSCTERDHNAVKIWPFLRRQITEMRDRFMPLNIKLRKKVCI